jgi:hypothetical protein
MRALSEVVDFNPPPPDQRQAEGQAPAAPAGQAVFPVHKGQSQSDVIALFGDPARCAREAQGALTVDTCTFEMAEATLEASFVDGVLVRYVLTSR